jgi:hypothetical protein
MELRPPPGDERHGGPGVFAGPTAAVEVTPGDRI